MVFDSHNRFIQNRPAANPTTGIWNKDVYKYPNKFVILSAMWRSKMEKTKNRAGKKERFEHIYKEYSRRTEFDQEFPNFPFCLGKKDKKIV